MNLVPAWLQSYVRADQPESPRALTLLVSAGTVCLSALGLAGAGIVRIVSSGDLGGGAVAVLLGSLATAAGLAGWHRQADPGQGQGPASKENPDA